MATDFRIGTSAGSMATLASMGVVEPMWDYTPSANRKDRADGLVRASGWPTVTWYYKFLGSQAYDALRTYCPNTSAEVYIKTKTSTNHYETFSGVMIWPERENWSNELVLDFEIKFRKLT